MTPGISRGLRFLTCASLLLATRKVSAQTFQLSAADLADSASLDRSMHRLVGEVLDVYRDSARVRYLDNRFRLELLHARYGPALETLAELQRLRATDTTPPTRARYLHYEIFAKAASESERTGQPLATTFADAFRATFARLDDRTAALVSRTILVSPGTVASDLRWATPDQSSKSTVSLDEALTVLRIYSATSAYRRFAGLPAALVAEDEKRRYIFEPAIPVKTKDGATVCASIVRPRGGAEKRPALLQFTIYADSVATTREALRSASNGYVGVTGFTRGKVCSPDKPVPYIHDGPDVAALIEWIATQPWSDGRVGMFGGSYSGFTAWAAAKQMPAPLRAIMVGAPVAPGIDVPMEGNVVWNFIYPWPFYTTNDRWLDNSTYYDFRRWNRMNSEWYRTGRPYRELEKIDGTPNPVFAEWIAHSTIDSFWTSLIPQGKEYAKVTIPVLQTAGYFAGGPGGAVYYFNEHYRHNPRANHYLLIGPYDHLQAQRGVVTPMGDTASFLAGYITDPVAWIDIVADLRYQWFDHVLRGAPRPALLRNRVNYEVMGANMWKSASSIAAASNGRLRMYFNSARSGESYSLSARRAANAAPITLTVNLADRSDSARRAIGGFQDTQIDAANGITLVGAPLKEATEVTGLISGHLELITNKRDFDFTITPYELTADGQYFQLPPYTSRASHVASLRTRRLLAPGKVQRLNFAMPFRMVSRKFAAGSRVVLVVAIVKGPGQQINYGSGKAVNDESIADAGDPLSIQWLPGSYVDLPIFIDR